VAFKSLGAVIGVACGYAVALVTGMAKNPTRPAPETT
jgi:xanthine/uracil permease